MSVLDSYPLGSVVEVTLRGKVVAYTNGDKYFENDNISLDGDELPADTVRLVALDLSAGAVVRDGDGDIMTFDGEWYRHVATANGESASGIKYGFSNLRSPVTVLFGGEE